MFMRWAEIQEREAAVAAEAEVAEVVAEANNIGKERRKGII